ncbi:MAG: PilT/PilU family type 4a pilus ATPase [Candidatus Ozemobacteraceae bacterium]
MNSADTDKLAQITEAFSTGHPGEIKRALAACENLQGEQFILLLLYKGLSNSDTAVQQKCAEYVGKRFSEAEALLQTLINHPNGGIRLWSISILGHAGKLDSAQLATYLTPSEKDDIKMLAADLLILEKNPTTLQTLICHLGDPSFLFRRHLSKLLLAEGEALLPAIKTVFTRGDLHQKYWALKLLVDVSGSKALRQIRKFLVSTDPTVRLYALAALEFVPGPEATAFLISALLETSPIMRHQAASSLKSKGETVLNELLEIMRTRGPELKDELIVIIGRIMGAKSREFFKTLVASSNPDDRFYALKAIGQKPDQEGIRLLIAAFKDPVWAIRSLSSSLLARLGPETTDSLINALGDSDFDTIAWAAKTLGSGRDQSAARNLLNLVDHHADDNVRVVAIKALCQLDIEFTVELLILNFKNAGLSVRNAIVEGLSGMTRTKSIKYLLMYLLDKDKTLSFWCEKTLKQLNYPGLPSVMKILVMLNDLEHERFMRYLHQLQAERITSILNREELILDDFDPEKIPEEAYVATAVNQCRDLRDLLAQVKEQKGSDLHMNIGLPPMIRIHGDLMRLPLPPLTEERASQLMLAVLNEEQLARFKDRWEMDFSLEVKHVARFRANIFKQRTGISGVFRLIPTVIPSFEELGLNRLVFEPICDHRNGLILVTGPTGSGKSTTMAAMVDVINKTRYEHILTIEDPIEFVHQHKRCSINQRELGAHTHSFSDALRVALREDPDVILVGEMRDQETIKLALTAAETGHLVFSTLHTINTYESINRIIGAFPSDHQDQVRLELSGVLRAVVSQKLIPRSDHKGRALAYEMLVCNIAVKNLIKEAKTEQIISIMQTAQGENMQTMDQSLAKHVLSGACTLEAVMPYVNDKKSFSQLTQPSKPSKTGPGVTTNLVSGTVIQNAPSSASITTPSKSQRTNPIPGK